MKKEWGTLAGICSVVIGIVLFCVIMGGYTSLLRAKGRIKAAKNLMAAECLKQLDIIPELVSLAGETAPAELIARIEAAAKLLPGLLKEINEAQDPLAPGLVSAFEETQGRLSRDTAVLVRGIGQDVGAPGKQVKAYQDLVAGTAYIARRYNKEARYFNHRKTVFPGFLVARLFGLDALHYPEIATTCLEPDTGTAKS